MRSKTTVMIIRGTLMTGVGVGYVGGAAASPTTTASPSESRKLGGAQGPMMIKMMDAEYAKMMRDPDMRRLHGAMIREHAQTMRDPEMRRMDKRAMRAFPEMASMMRKHMAG